VDQVTGWTEEAPVAIVTLRSICVIRAREDGRDPATWTPATVRMKNKTYRSPAHQVQTSAGKKSVATTIHMRAINHSNGVFLRLVRGIHDA